MGVELINLTAEERGRIPGLSNKLVFNGDNIKFKITVSNYANNYGYAHIHAEDDKGAVWLHAVGVRIDANKSLTLETYAKSVQSSFTLTVTVTDLATKQVQDTVNYFVRVLPIQRL